MVLLYYFLLSVIALLSAPATILASTPFAWQIGFQEPASPLMQGVADMHTLLLIIITGVAILVMGLVLYIIWFFHAKRHPIPSKTAHHTLLEIVWTALPVVILTIIAIPSLRLLFFADQAVDAQLTIKAVGNQWFWSYEYLNEDPSKVISFDSYMIDDKEIKPGQQRLLEVDNRVVIPVNATVKVLVTASDVLHSFAVPALGIKTDAVPGRTNETWFRINKEGVYYGQCSELCGAKHGFMPIAIEVVSEQKYQAWVQEHSPKKSSSTADSSSPTTDTSNAPKRPQV